MIIMTCNQVQYSPCNQETNILNHGNFTTNYNLADPSSDGSNVCEAYYKQLPVETLQLEKFLHIQLFARDVNETESATCNGWQDPAVNICEPVICAIFLIDVC